MSAWAACQCSSLTPLGSPNHLPPLVTLIRESRDGEAAPAARPAVSLNLHRGALPGQTSPDLAGAFLTPLPAKGIPTRSLPRRWL